MDRMKTFFKYALLIVGFFILSLILENELIMGMYGTITGNTNMSSNLGLDIQLEDSRATNINGYIRFKVKNTTGHFTQKCYAKIDLYSKQDLLAATKYAEINNFRANEERKFELKFKANEISRYNIEIV